MDQMSGLSKIIVLLSISISIVVAFLRKIPFFKTARLSVTWNAKAIERRRGLGTRPLWNCSNVALAILLVGLAATSPALPPAPLVTANAQPELLQMAAQQPDQVIAVIVQKADMGTPLEAEVERLGGTVTNELKIINAFGAQMPAHAAVQLSRMNGVRWVSIDAPLQSTSCSSCISTSRLLNAYTGAVRAQDLWNRTPYLQGQGITVAIIDSGVTDHTDFKAEIGGNGDLRILANPLFVAGTDKFKDWYGHGTHVAGIIGGNGTKSEGRYIGIAPKVNIVSVNVTNNYGQGQISDVVEGLEWVLNNKTKYKIRVVNVSINSSVSESYHTSPLAAACEILWFNGIVVVVSAGNNGLASNGILYPPANDPFVITVGATDDRGTVDINDDVVASFSAYGVTESGISKPDILAPGKNIISTLSKPDTFLATAHPSNKVYTFTGSQDYYFRMSGTSMAAPIVSGAVALLLQDEPGLNPDQVKYRLMATANKSWPGYNSSLNDAGYLDIFAAVNGNTSESANTGLMASNLLTTGTAPITSSVSWNSVSWNSVSWNSVSWNSVSWNSVSWNSDYWGQ